MEIIIILEIFVHTKILHQFNQKQHMSVSTLSSSLYNQEECERSLESIILCWKYVHGMYLDRTTYNSEWYILLLDIHSTWVWWNYTPHISWEYRISIYEGEYRYILCIYLYLENLEVLVPKFVLWDNSMCSKCQ